MKLFKDQLIVTFHEKEQRGCRELNSTDDLQALNDDGWGIYFSVNGFRNVSTEEHSQNNTRQARNKRYLQNIYYCYGDLDIAKEGEDLTQKEKDERKIKVIGALKDHCMPSHIIWTKNGVQALWKVNCKASDVHAYELANQGIVTWSKAHGCLGDNVFDATRILRVPNFYHNKGDKYLCEVVAEDPTDKVYKLEELLEKFPEKPKTKEQKEYFSLDISEVIIEAARTKGIEITFKDNSDGSKQILEDGKETSGFVSGRGNFCYSSSGNDRKGGIVQLAAFYLEKDYSDACQWLTDTFGIRAKAVTSMPFVSMSELTRDTIQYYKKIDPEKIYKYGYKQFDEHLGGIYRGEVVLLGGETKTGKTTFLTSILKNNAEKHSVSFFCLEDALTEYALKQIWFEIGRARKAEGKTNYPWVMYRNNEIIDTNFDKYMAEAAAKISTESGNLSFYDMNNESAPDMMNIDTLETMIERMARRGVGLFGVDHLHFFNNFVSRDSKADRIEEIMKRIKTLADRNNVAIILLAHYRKLNGEKPSLDSFKDSSSIVQIANVVINMWRDRTSETTETHFALPAVRSPSGEATITMNFNKETFTYEPVETTIGVSTSEQF